MYVQSCPTLCDPMKCSPPGSSVLGISQVRILEWVANGLLWWLRGKESAWNALGWEDPLEKEKQPTLVFLPGKSHGHRNLVGYSTWGRQESDMTGQLSTHTQNSLNTEILCFVCF